MISVLSAAACFGPQSPAPATHYGAKPGAGSAGVHTVSQGETLWEISQRYNIVMRDIAASNNLHPPFVLRMGQRLRLPPPREYQVRRGDTLYAVSRIFGVSISELASLNDLQAPYAIHTGQSLRLPSPAVQNTAAVRAASAPVTPVRKPEPIAAEQVGDTASSSLPVQQTATASKPQTKITAKTPKRSSGKFLKPVEGQVVSSYGPKKNGLHNDGINIKAPKGTPVRAAENGVVVYAGNELKGSGNLVLVRHDSGWMSAYAHMDRLLIKRGAVVTRGQSIGTVGQTGSVDEPQLHFEIRRGTEAINPARYLEGGKA